MISSNQVTSSGTKSCLFVSEEKLWPYKGSISTSVFQPELVCQSMGLNLAEITSEEERVALQEMTSKILNFLDCFVIKYDKYDVLHIGCAMSNFINDKSNVLVKSGGITGQSTVCSFQKFDGTFHGSDVSKRIFIKKSQIFSL